MTLRAADAAGNARQAGPQRDGLLAGELGPVQVGVQPPGREQLVVLAALADPAARR